jgi:hypothetical protein
VEGPCEYSNEPSRFIECWEVLEEFTTSPQEGLSPVEFS